jgi:LuxR family maltose regulon positive regulatory protein
VDESVAFLNQIMGLNLPPEEVAALEARTEGWIAGLQIAALSMQGQDDVSEFIRAFSGSHRHILGYLAEEVLNQQPKGTLKFLLQTSILERLCGPLCDAVTGDSGGQEILENLEQTNLFITPLDNVSGWFRYHNLFAEVLQARLMRTRRDQVHELHRRASHWFARQGMFDDALQHALAAADYEQAAHLIEHVAGKMLRKGTAAALIRWLDAVPEETIRARPRLCLARGWTYLWGPIFSLESAEEWIQFATKGNTPGSVPGSDLEGEIAALKALIAANRVDLDLSQELAHRALEHLPADSPWLGVTTFCLGSTLYAAGEFSAATPVLTEALHLSQAEGALYTQLIAGSFLGDIQAFQGRLGRAVEIYRQVLAYDDSDIPQKGALVAHAGLANVLCEQNQLDAALAHVHSGLEQLEQVGGPGAALWLYRTLARIKQAKGSWAEALEALNQAYKSGESARSTFVMAQAAALRTRLLLTRGDLAAATAWAAECGLDPEDPQASHSGLREMEFITYARVLSAQGLHQPAQSLLERLLIAALDQERRGSAIEMLALRGLIFQAQGNGARAQECIEQSLTLAEAEGYVRLFVDEGEPMRLLLREYQSLIRRQISDRVDEQSIRLLAYNDRLLAACSPPANGQKPTQDSIVEPLSERERDILRLIATGRSNQEIAEILVIAVSTVKSHINNLYGKLGTNRRTEAIAIARDNGLLSN